MSRLAIVSMALLVVVMVAAGAFALLSTNRAPVRLGVVHWPGFEPLFLARDEGFFAGEGLDVELIEYASLGDVASAYAHGDVDGMACSLHEVVSVLARSPVQPRIVLVTDCSLGGDQVLVNSELGGVADLRGRRVGVEAASLGVYILHRALSRVGLTLDDVKLIASEPTTLASDLAEKRIDAAVTYPPYSHALTDIGARTVFSSADIPGEILDVIVLDAAILRERPDIRERLDRVWDGIHEWIRVHPQEAPARMARHIGLDADTFLKSYAGMRTYDSATSRAALVPLGDVHRTLQRIAETNLTLGLTQAVDLTGVCDG